MRMRVRPGSVPYSTRTSTHRHHFQSLTPSTLIATSTNPSIFHQRQLQSTRPPSLPFPPLLPSSSPSSSPFPIRGLATPTPPHRQSLGRIQPVHRSPPTPSPPSHLASSLPQQFDIDPDDPTPRNQRERLWLRLRRAFGYGLVALSAVTTTAALVYLTYVLRYDPGYLAHVHSFTFLAHHPRVLELLGEPLVDKSDPARQRGSTSAVRKQANTLYVVVRYRVEGSQKGAVVSCEVKREGKSWVVTYADVHLDGARQPVVIADYRRRIYEEERKAAAAEAARKAAADSAALAH